MDEQRRRDLKREGKRLVEENWKQLRRKLFDRNPFPVGHPDWVANLKAEYEISRDYRRNADVVLAEADVLKNADIRVFDIDYERGFSPSEGMYVLCKSCRDLVPTACVAAAGCRCDKVIIDPESRQVRLPVKDMYSVVRLDGRGPRQPSHSRSWWRFWHAS